MSGMSVGPARVIVAEFTGSGVNVNAYRSFRAALLKIVSDSSGWTGGGWGSDLHVSGLEELLDVTTQALAMARDKEEV